MDFVAGPPTLAVEVRSKEDYGPAAEAALAAKRLDYLQAGTRAVWDVDPRAERARSHLGSDRLIVFNRGQAADAGPAVPGWEVVITAIFA